MSEGNDDLLQTPTWFDKNRKIELFVENFLYLRCCHNERVLSLALDYEVYTSIQLPYLCCLLYKATEVF